MKKGTKGKKQKTDSTTTTPTENFSIRYCVFDYGGVCGGTSKMVSEAAYIAGKSQVPFMSMDISPDALIERARSRVLGLFMKHCKESVLLMVDRDIVSPRSANLISMCRDAYSLDRIIGGLYCKKRFGDGWAGAALQQEPMKIGDPTAPPVEAHYIATGCLAIPRKAISRMEKFAADNDLLFKDDKVPAANAGLCEVFEKAERLNGFRYYDWFKTYRAYGDEHWFTTGEDQAFSYRVRNLGEKVWLAQAYVYGHVGEFTYMPDHGVKGIESINVEGLMQR